MDTKLSNEGPIKSELSNTFKNPLLFRHHMKSIPYYIMKKIISIYLVKNKSERPKYFCLLMIFIFLKYKYLKHIM